MTEKTYAIYTYEVIPRGDKKIKFTADNGLVIDDDLSTEDKVHLIINRVMSHKLTVIGKKHKKDLPLIVQNLHGHDDVYAFVLCNERDITYYEGKKLENIVTHPGCYVVVDNRKGVCQIAIEDNDVFDMERNQAVKYLSRSFNSLLHDYGLEIVIKHKFSAQSFVTSVKERLYTQKDSVVRIVWEFPNAAKVACLDATEEQKAWIQQNMNMVAESEALKGIYTLVGSKKHPLQADTELNKHIALMIELSAQNGYNLKYHFANSGVMNFKMASHAFMNIKESFIEDFMQGVTVHGDGVVGEEGLHPTYDLILRLDQIRCAIVSYDHEDIIPLDEN